MDVLLVSTVENFLKVSPQENKLWKFSFWRFPTQNFILYTKLKISSKIETTGGKKAIIIYVYRFY